MKPRSVTLQSNSNYFIWLTASSRTPDTPRNVLTHLSQLTDIVSDDVKRRRPNPPLGLKESKRNGYKTNFVREPKNTTYTKRVIYYPNGAHEVQNTRYPDLFPYPWYVYSGGQPPTSLVYTDFGDPALLARADKRLKSKFFNKLKNSEVDLALTLAERTQTKVMIARRAVLLLNVKRWAKAFWKRIRQRSIQQHESIAKAMANAWLELVYGWKQLANDIFGIASFTASRSMNRYVKIREAVSSTSRSKSFTDNATGVHIDVEQANSVISEMKIHLNVTADPVLDLTRLATLNPIAIAWELVPFSFVFDWIINISNYLNELQTRCMFSTSLGGGYVTHVERCELTGRYPPGKTTGSFSTLTLRGEIKYRDIWTKKTRTLFGSAPLPVFPTLKSPLSLEHALTTLSLVVQRLKPKHMGRDGRYM